jgi:hypothetical protein
MLSGMVQNSNASADLPLRHTLATLAYRAGKTLRGASPGFENFAPAAGTRTPVQILAHMGDLLDWAAGLADGRNEFHESVALPWDQEVDRFFTALATLDQRLASAATLGFPVTRIFAGPIADALTHTGQIALLRRMAGAPVRGENYFRAEITLGRVGRDQAAPVREFD